MATQTGKTHSRHFRLFLDEVDLSGDMRNIGSAGIEYAEDDATGWSDGIINFTLGMAKTAIEGFQAVFNTTALLGSYVEMVAREQYIASLLVGIRAAPLVGDICMSAQLEQKNINVDGEGPVLINVSLVGPGQVAVTGGVTEALPEKVFGRVLEPGAVSRTATLTGDSVRNFAQAATTAGALGYLHVLASTGGVWSLKIQDSANDAAWADLITFDADGTVITSEQEYVAGSVDQYTRALFTRTAGNITVVCTIVRL